jgi:homoserine O-acetyltransferase/O-succinyltransferase
MSHKACDNIAPMRFALSLLLAVSAYAANYPAPVEHDWIVRDFRFHTGQVLPELRLHYTTVGEPSGQPVLILHGTSGSGGNFLEPRFSEELYGPGQSLDATRYFVILPDAIGHGQSSKPSDGLKGQFPQYNYDDMVRAQYRLVTEHMGIRHLRLIIGGSMGGMHAWMWGEMYPAFADALMPLQCLPREIAGINRMLRRVVIDGIRNDPEWQSGNYQKPPSKALFAATVGSLALFGEPVQLYNSAPTREKADAEFDRRISEAGSSDINNMLYAFEASRDYNPAPDLERIQARVIAINTADDSVNQPELGVMEREIKRVKNGTYVLIPRSAPTNGHSSYRIGILYAKYLTELLAGR